MKRIALLCSIIAIVLMFVSCGKSNNDLVINSYMSDEAPKKAFADIVEKFKAQNPGVAVTVNTFAHEQFKKLLPTWLTSKSAPEVATWFAGYRMQSFAAKGLLEPIDEVFPGEQFENEFPKAFKTASSYKDRVYFLPQSWYWWGVYYNKDVFKKLNLQTPGTWDEFITVCEKLKASGYAPIAIGAKDTWTTGGWFDYINTAVNGGDFHRQLTNGKVSYSDPRVKATFSYIAELAGKGFFMPNAASYSWQEAANQLLSGKAGMYLMGQFIKDVIPADAKNRIDFFPFPIVKGNIHYSVDTPTDGYVLPYNAKNKKLAKKFLKFIATAGMQEAFCKPLGRLAGNLKVSPANDEAKKGLAMVAGASDAAQFYDRDAPEEMASKGMDAIVAIMTDPQKMDAILADLDKERVRIYEAQK